MVLQVGFTFNLKRDISPEENLPEDFYAEWDDIHTIKAVKKALEKGGARVKLIEADERAFERLKRSKVDFVFNMAEGYRGESRESHVPAMLEMLKIPYTGSGPLTLALALDKAMTKEVLSHHNIPNPKFQIFRSVNDKLKRGLAFPLIVKPIREGSSMGIFNNAIVRNDAELRTRVVFIIKTYEEPALVEEFLEGREFTVGVLGNGKDAVILPIEELLFDALPEGANRIYSYEAKWVWDTPEKPLKIFQCPAKIPKRLENRIKKVVLQAYKVLDCHDVTRIDVRLGRNNKVNIIEVNPLPGLLPDPDQNSCLPNEARSAGLSFEQLINTILFHALKRHSMHNRIRKKYVVVNFRKTGIAKTKQLKTQTHKKGKGKHGH